MSEKKVDKPQVWVDGCIECPSGCSDDSDNNTLDMTFEIPGVKKDDIHLNITKDFMRLRAERSDVEFVSSYPFDCDADIPKVKSEYNEGLLTVHIPQICPDPMKDSVTVKID